MYSEKRWVITPGGDSARVEAISQVHGISPILAELLVQRGIDTPQSAYQFFNPSLEELHDPFLMRDMMVAVQRIEKALLSGERIMVYGDYDVDGTTAVSLVYLFLKGIAPDPSQLLFYIPDRYAEGYGVSQRGVDYANENNVSLVITLDCGIKAIEKVAYAKTLGIDFIICDHHLPDEQLPEAVAVLDPKRLDCEYPFKELSGCGVGFKLAQAFCMYREISFDCIFPLLDLVVVSIASDIVPIVGENRIMAHYGLIQLNSENVNKGLGAIIRIAGLERHPIQIDDIIFKIGPRINAAGRMEIEIDQDDPRAQSGGRTAVKLLTAPTPERALYYVEQIDNFNQDRKSIDRNITIEAHQIIERDRDFVNKRSTVIYNPQWVKGVVGIVASRLIESYYRPTVVLTMSNGMITGSARSIPGFDLYQAVEHCSDLLENFGGHTYAAGLTMRPENLDAFLEKFEKFVKENIDNETLTPQIKIDGAITLSDITPKLRSDLLRFQPFGPGNPAPTFRSTRVCDNGRARRVGANGDHLKMELWQGVRPYSSISAIAFGQTRFASEIIGGHPIDVCFNLVENHYQGNITPQLRIRDIRLCQR
ncbi:MAG: single-stranded-DNA-specific exonuclease RecJ [Rikenellaceae bacterium]